MRVKCFRQSHRTAQSLMHTSGVKTHEFCLSTLRAKANRVLPTVTLLELPETPPAPGSNLLDKPEY